MVSDQRTEQVLTKENTRKMKGFLLRHLLRKSAVVNQQVGVDKHTSRFIHTSVRKSQFGKKMYLGRSKSIKYSNASYLVFNTTHTLQLSLYFHPSVLGLPAQTKGLTTLHLPCLILTITIDIIFSLAVMAIHKQDFLLDTNM